jgi:hypothetical protein
VAAVYNVCHVAGGVDTVINMARRISYGALFAVGFWSASIVLHKWMSSTKPSPVGTRTQGPKPTSAAEGPGRYRVTGVDDETKFQTTEVIYAESPSNAQLKVELKGVHVDAVERAG